MRNLLLIIFIFSSFIASAQEKYRDTVQIVFNIGISDEVNIFDQVKEYLSKDNDVMIVAKCEQYKVFVVKILNKELKDQTKFMDKLQKKFKDTEFFIKYDDSIMLNECKGESKKE